MQRFRRLSKGEVLLASGLALVAGGVAILQAELRAESQSSLWVIGSLVLVVLGGCLLGVTALEHLNNRRGLSRSSDLCGDAARRLRWLAKGARQLAHNLDHFPNWWPAVEDEAFDGRLPDGLPVTHPEAMQTLLFMFAQFFSAAWTYQDHCLGHRRRDEIVGLVDEVYNALGNHSGGPDDVPLRSDQLHVVGERSTSGWGTAEARPVERSGFRVRLEHHPEDFRPLEVLLHAAAPDTEARARLEATAKAVKAVEEGLRKRGYRP